MKLPHAIALIFAAMVMSVHATPRAGEEAMDVKRESEASEDVMDIVKREPKKGKNRGGSNSDNNSTENAAAALYSGAYGSKVVMGGAVALGAFLL